MTFVLISKGKVYISMVWRDEDKVGDAVFKVITNFSWFLGMEFNCITMKCLKNGVVKSNNGILRNNDKEILIFLKNSKYNDMIFNS